ncbi:MAG: ORF6N domain-containing protein [Candidatus Bipolaricaulis sp.]|nr:ORF6N domain-containing protein [Candidatus Bipolaricaulis sp.]MDD5219974.1 ORF6N domain-containing protein [Candidatus Bipolaricaulis sp.]MDD5645911.1 ORF6N domain-containing protein [Candidatus Bipolaricaulis sp.]
MLERASAESSELRIVEVRGVKVIIDSDLAGLFGVATQRLNQAVKRNPGRFPAEFLFQLTMTEFAKLKSRSASSTWKGRRHPPYAFTEYGAMMAACVLDSPRAVDMSLFVIRAFVRLRSIYASHIELTRRLDELDIKVGGHDEAIRSIVEAIRRLMLPESPRRSLIGASTFERWPGYGRPR